MLYTIGNGPIASCVSCTNKKSTPDCYLLVRATYVKLTPDVPRMLCHNSTSFLFLAFVFLVCPNIWQRLVSSSVRVSIAFHEHQRINKSTAHDQLNVEFTSVVDSIHLTRWIVVIRIGSQVDSRVNTRIRIQSGLNPVKNARVNRPLLSI